MISFLRSNRPSFLVLSPILALGALLAGHALMTVPYVETGWAALDSWLPGQPWVAAGLQAVLIGLQAFLLYRICVLGNFFQQSTQLPALFWSLMAGCIAALGTDLLLQAGLIFSLLSARRMVAVYRQNRVLHLVFEAGFWAGVAIWFDPGFVLLTASLVLSLAYTRKSSWREWTVLVLGLLSPLYLWVLGKWTFEGNVFLTGSGFPELKFPGFESLHSAFWLILLLTGGVVGLLAFIRSWSEDSNQTRNAKNHMLFYVLAVLVGLSWFAEGSWMLHYTAGLPSLSLFAAFVLFIPGRAGQILSALTLLSVVLFGLFILMNNSFV